MQSHGSAVAERVRDALREKDLIDAAHHYAARCAPPGESKDIAQEALTRAYENAHRFPVAEYGSTPSPDAVKKWVWNLVREEASKHYKRRSRRTQGKLKRCPPALFYPRPARRDRHAEEQEEKRAETDPEPVSWYDQFPDDRPRRRELRQIVETLPRTHREIIEGWFFEEKPYEELADELGISQQAARQRLHRAIEHLRPMFGQFGYSNDGGRYMVSKQDFRLYLSLRYVEAIAKSDYNTIIDIWRQAAEDPRLAETLDLLDEQIEIDFKASRSSTRGGKRL
jgi:RNA polymerase sigma factor (sigma-70 family)